MTMRLAAVAGGIFLLVAVQLAHAQRTEIRWVRIPSGSFAMGCVPQDADCSDDERPRHRVGVTVPFDLMATEVTVELFSAFAASGPSSMPVQPPWNRDPIQPIVNVTWNEASAFCRSVGGRLPTEAEWEYAARGGRPDAIYSWGDGLPPLIGSEPAANVADESTKRDYPDWTIFAGYSDGHPMTAPAGSFPANAYGLHDMGGNVWEWIADWYASDYYQHSASSDPHGPASGVARVVRGGSWGDYSRGLRLSYRSLAQPGARGLDVGFRCAR